MVGSQAEEMEMGARRYGALSGVGSQFFYSPKRSEGSLLTSMLLLFSN
jgi:hypothetical protein